MVLLALNTATSQTEIALIEKGKVLSEQSWLSSRDEAEKILPMLASLLQKKSKNSKPFDKIFVVEGPGPFTALRLGVTIANTLGFVFGVPILTCTTFEYFLRKIPAAEQKNTAIVLKAGGGFFSILLPEAKHPESLNLEQMPTFFKNKPIHFLVGEVTLEDQKTISETVGIGWIEKKDLKTFGEVAIEITKEKQLECRIAEPYYLQPPKITQSKKKVFN